MNRTNRFYYFWSWVNYQRRLSNFKEQWRKKNPHNGTVPNSIFPLETVSVGKGTYGELNVFGFDNPETILTIGNFCSIAGNVRIFVGGEHYCKYLTTFPIAVMNGFTEKLHPEYASKGSVIVDDDVWIGDSCIVLSGVHIGQGAVIGAGTVVAKDIPPYAIYAGDRILKFRFSEDVISKLVHVDISKLDVIKYRKYCDVEITSSNVDQILQEMRL